MDPVHDRGSMDPVQESVPWTRSKEGAHGPCFVLTQISGPTSPTWKVSKKLVHLLRWTTFPGRTGWNFGWMDGAHFGPQIRASSPGPTEILVGRTRNMEYQNGNQAEVSRRYDFDSSISEILSLKFFLPYNPLTAPNVQIWRHSGLLRALQWFPYDCNLHMQILDANIRCGHQTINFTSVWSNGVVVGFQRLESAMFFIVRRIFVLMFVFLFPRDAGTVRLSFEFLSWIAYY